MKTQIKVISLVNANAVQSDITITADIDTIVDVTRIYGTPLPSSIAMQYLPDSGKSLKYHKDMIKLWFNSDKSNLNFSMASKPSLNDVTGNSSIPLKVSVDSSLLAKTRSGL